VLIFGKDFTQRMAILIINFSMFSIRNYTYNELRRDIEFLLKKYLFLNCESIGKSVCGRDIFAISSGNLKLPKLYNASHHGMEWITSWALMSFIDDFVLNFDNVCFIPMVNPDGVEIALSGRRWQANARGVDINHNYPANWKSTKKTPSWSRFGGFYPNSEPETNAIIQYTKNFKPSKVFALHSQGEEIYWEFNGSGDINYAEKMANLSGYKVAEPVPLASFGGYKDWFIEEFNRPGYTIEIGKGINPLALSSFKETYAKILAMFEWTIYN